MDILRYSVFLSTGRPGQLNEDQLEAFKASVGLLRNLSYQYKRLLLQKGYTSLVLERGKPAEMVTSADVAKAFREDVEMEWTPPAGARPLWHWNGDTKGSGEATEQGVGFEGSGGDDVIQMFKPVFPMIKIPMSSDLVMHRRQVDKPETTGGRALTLDNVSAGQVTTGLGVDIDALMDRMTHLKL